MIKRFMSALLVICLILVLMPSTSWAASIVNSGQCGSNATWVQDSDGTLTISGTGPMANYDVILNWSPWHMGSAKAIKIDEGITTIGSAAFGWMFSLKTIEIPRSVVAIGSDAFNNSRMITDIYYAGTEAEWNNIKIYSGNYTLNSATIHFGSKVSSNKSGSCGPQLNWSLSADGILTISGTGRMDDFTGGGDGTAPWYSDRKNIKAVIIEEGVTSIGYCAFWDCTNIITVDLPDTLTVIGGFSFALCTSMEKIDIPFSVTQIDFSAFGACYALTSITIPDRVTMIVGQTFAECTGLKEITLPSGITSIGDVAFSECPSLRDVYFRGSESDWDAIRIGNDNDDLLRATIHCSETNSGEKEEIPEQPKEYCIHRNGGAEKFTYSFEECMNQYTSSGTYNPELAYMLISMCNSVYNSTDIATTFSSFGFEYIMPRYEKEYITYSVAKKQMEDGTPLILAVAKGTGPLYWEDNPDSSGWNSNIWGYLSTSNNLHSGYSDAADEIYNDIKNLLKSSTDDLSKAKFILTGFSRGAATANILAAKLVNEGVAQSHIYAYTFACPDSTQKTFSGYDCIFNINDAEDVVSWIPSGAFGGVFSGWDKYGRSYWFSNNWDSSDLEMGTDAHNQASYMGFLSQRKDTSEYRRRNDAKKALDRAADARSEQFWTNVKNGGYHQIGEVVIACPVDVNVYASGKLVGYIAGNLAEVKNNNKVYISVIDGQKRIYLLDNDTYTFDLTATDEGTMTYSIGNIDTETRTSIDKLVFQNVVLSTGKQFASTVKVENDLTVDVGTQEIKLYVLGGDGEPEKQVLPDNKGTEIPIGSIPEQDTSWINPFTDVAQDAWYYDAVKYVNLNGLMSGTGNNMFEPDTYLSRAMLAQIVYNRESRPQVFYSNAFSDVTYGKWYTDAVLWAANEKIVFGYGDRIFGPEDNITREQLATILWRYAGSPTAANRVLNFVDASKSGDYAFDALCWASENGIINGIGNNMLDPAGVATRAQTAQMLKVFFSR